MTSQGIIEFRKKNWGEYVAIIEVSSTFLEKGIDGFQSLLTNVSTVCPHLQSKL